MQEEGFSDAATARLAKFEPLEVVPRSATRIVQADYFIEEVRRELIERFGETALYEGGLSVRTTLDPQLQKIADQSLSRGLVAYDRRHGWGSEERRVGKECFRTGRSRWAPVH